MKNLNILVLGALFVFSVTAYAAGHEHNHGALAEPQGQTQNLPEITPASTEKGGCEKCRKMGKGGSNQEQVADGGMGGCKCKMGGGEHGSGSSKYARELEERIDELEKRLDLMQMLLMRGYR